MWSHLTLCPEALQALPKPQHLSPGCSCSFEQCLCAKHPGVVPRSTTAAIKSVRVVHKGLARPQCTAHPQRQLALQWSDAERASADAVDASAQQTSSLPLFGQHQDRPILPPDVLSWTGFEQPHQVPHQLSQHTLVSVHIYKRRHPSKLPPSHILDKLTLKFWCE